MSSRSLARPASVFAVTALVLTSAWSLAAPPSVPPAAEIPVAPLPRAKKVEKVETPAREATTTTTVTTTTVTAPAIVAMAPVAEPKAAPETRSGVVEAMPTPGPRVVLTDEPPFRPSKSVSRELPEHRRSGKKGRHGRPYHPAPGIVVDVSDATGGTRASDLERAARNLGYWPFRHCYEGGLERNQKLSGYVSLSIAPVAPQGPTSAELGASTIRDESVSLCVAREAQHLSLPWSAGAEGAHAAMKIVLSTGDEPVPVPRAVPHADELQQVLRASWPAVQQCYASGLARHPDAGGRMELRFRVKSSGEILEVAEDEPRFGDVDVTRCVLGVYRAAKLPPMHGAHAGTFAYAMRLEAAAGVAP